MTKYERLMAEAEKRGLTVIEVDAGTDKNFGKNYDDLIVINSNMDTKSKACILAEELGHCLKTCGNITDYSKTENYKKEQVARRWSYEKLIGIVDLINAHKLGGCRNIYEIADYIGVNEDILENALSYYNCKYPDGYRIDNYWINFNNGLEIYEMF